MDGAGALGLGELALGFFFKQQAADEQGRAVDREKAAREKIQKLNVHQLQVGDRIGAASRNVEPDSPIAPMRRCRPIEAPFP